MGFFDKLDSMLEKADKYLAELEREEQLKSRPQYSLSELVQYFVREIEGNTKMTTINELLTKQVKSLDPNVYSWEWVLKSNAGTKSESFGDGTYYIEYHGILHSHNIYGKYTGEFSFDVYVYTDKYASLVSHEGNKSTVSVSKSR